MSLFDSAIGLVAPPSCVVCSVEGAALCANCIESEIIPYGETCWSCGVRSPGGRTCQRCRLPGTPTYVWISTTYEGAGAELLKAYKFGHLRAAASTLADIMAKTIDDFLPDKLLSQADYLAVSIPTATGRLRGRGFDHSELLARSVAKKLGLHCAPALGRLGQSRQVGAKRQERLMQIDNKLYVRLPSLVKNRRILLIDDVVTTGATLRAATKALRAAGARRVDALVFAKRP